MQSTILERADALIHGDRQQEYGDAEDNFIRIAALWSAYTGYGFSPYDVPMMLCLLKIARCVEGPHTDSLVDLAGYAALAHEIDKPAQAEERAVGAKEFSAAAPVSPGMT